MDFQPTERQTHWRDRVRDFIEKEVRPAVPTYQQQDAEGDRWKVIPVVEELKEKARAKGLWNMFMPPRNDSHHHVDESFEFEGPGLTNLEYAMVAEELGRIGFASETMNCSAPDTGNMEVLHRYGTREQKEQWLEPLMNGKIRSAFLMTEPQVASSDATNIETSIIREGDEYVINGRKWWSSGAGDPRCKVAIVMGKSDTSAQRHQQQSMILMPLDAEGVTIDRYLPVFGYDDAPHGHMEITLKNVRVPASAMLLGEGRGFEIAQGRLGPGRIHHCMRSIGAAERAIELMCRRGLHREAFGKTISHLGKNMEVVSRARIEIEAMRLMVLRAAKAMDTMGNAEARVWISAVKAMVPEKVCQIIDQAIQVHGATGVSQWTPLSRMYTQQRTLRLADGPDEVHHFVVARFELNRYQDGPGPVPMLDHTGPIFSAP